MLPANLSFGFYKAEYGSFFSRTIAFWTGGQFSHTETIWSREGSLWALENLFPHLHPGDLLEDERLSFSASERDKMVRMKIIAFDPRKWVFVDTSVYLPQEKEIIEWCDKNYIGKGYDYLGLFSFILKRFRIINPSKTKFWCSETSELVANHIGLCGLDEEPSDPNEFYKKVV